MTRCFRLFLFFGAFLQMALPGTVCAAEEVAKEKSDVPVGYEEAAETKKKEEKEADVPAGYKDSAKADKREKKVRKPVAAEEWKLEIAPKALADQEKLLAVNPQVKALAAEMRQQLKPFFAAELSFAKTVCEPNAEQLQQMKALATPGLEKAILATAIQEARMRPMMGVGGRLRRVRQDQGDVFEQFDKAASRIVSQVFSDEIVQAYQVEQKTRKEFRAHAGAMALVAHLDARYRFSKSQRETITESFQQVWQRTWQRYLQIMAHNPQFFPPVPDDSILPHLNDVQTKLWKTTKHQNLGFHWRNLNNRGLFQNIKQEIDWFEEAAEKAQGDGNVNIHIDAAVGEFVVVVKENVKDHAVDEKEEME